jgi:hypothetical protein
MSISDNVDLGRPLYMDLPNFYAITTLYMRLKRGFEMNPQIWYVHCLLNNATTMDKCQFFTYSNL